MIASPEGEGKHVTVDRDRLIKLLNMTQSVHDGESLSAIRASNALMRQSNLTWTDLIAVAPAPKPVSEAPPTPPQPVYERKEPVDRPAHWGQDIFGDQPSVPPQGHEPKPRPKKVQDAKDALKAKIAAVPLWLRVIFFPVWFFAFAYATAVHAEPWPTQMIAIFAPVAVGGLTGVLWVIIVRAIAQQFGY